MKNQLDLTTATKNKILQPGMINVYINDKFLILVAEHATTGVHSVMVITAQL